MFCTVRHWWKGGRGKVAARLFRPIRSCDEMWRANATDIDLLGTPG